VTDTGGAVVTRNDYDAYGRLTRVAGTENWRGRARRRRRRRRRWSAPEWIVPGISESSWC